MSQSSRPDRQPGGIPVGGQFAASSRSESGVTLTERQPATALPGEDGETLVRSFSCENHDGPGECSQECVDLVSLMDTEPPSDFGYDPTGCRNPRPTPYRTYEYDAEARASICVTHVPEGEALVSTLRPGQRIWLDGHVRTVATVVPAPRRMHRLQVEFEPDDPGRDNRPLGPMGREFEAGQAVALDDQAAIKSLTKGQWVWLDDEQRQVDSVTAPDDDGNVWVDFASYDRDVDSTPSFFLSREMPADNLIGLVDSDAIPSVPGA